MSKHTPGPWKIRDEREDWYASGATFEIDTHHNEHIGFVTRSTCGISDKEALANARLIAAAPDLLEALEAFPGFNAEPDEIAAWTVQMSAAIAKATGGTDKIVEGDE